MFEAAKTIKVDFKLIDGATAENFFVQAAAVDDSIAE